MAGSLFQPGDTKIRPGIYVRAVNIGDPPQAALAQGIVAALLRATWGPLGTPTKLENFEDIAATFGSGSTLAVAEEAFRGNAQTVLAYRLGTGGAKATKTLQDTSGSPVNAVQIDAKYVGTRGNSLKLTLRDSLTEPSTKRELLVYEDTTLRQTITFTKGSGGDGEPKALVDAVAASSSPWITATKLADGNKILAAVTQTTLAAGADVTVSAGDYSTALSGIERDDWNVLAIDSEDASVHATVLTYIQRVRTEGKRVMAVVGEATTVAFATRQTNAKALNEPAVVYVGNGFTKTDGTTIEGYKAAARVAGMIAGSSITSSLTHRTVASASALVGALTNAEIETAINAGILAFSLNAKSQVQIEYGITSLSTLNADQDAGWRKIRRVRTRDYLMAKIAESWDPLIGAVNNDANGRATLMAVAQGVINDLIRDGALKAGSIKEDAARPAAGDSAWFLLTIDDLDAVEHLYLEFGFRFSPPAA